MTDPAGGTVKVTPELDPEVLTQIKATLRGITLDAITDALYAVASGMTLSEAEDELLDKYRRCPEQHRLAALRTLDRGLPTDKPASDRNE